MDVRRFGLSDEDMEALGYKVRKEAPEPSEPSELPGLRPDPVDRSRRTWLWTAGILIALGWSTSSYRSLPDPVPANRPDTVFSSGRAMAQLVEIARDARPTGSPEHARVGAFIEDRLRSLGLDPEVQTVTFAVAESGSAQSATVRNIVARVPGVASTGAVALTAHYDAVPLSSGAGDDGVGIASILETLRAVLAGEPLRNDLVVVFTDAAELGSLGARAFVEHHPWMADIVFVIGAEARGVSGPSLMLEREAENGGLVEVVARASARPVANSLSRELGARLVEGTDLAIFLTGGAQGLSLSAMGGHESYHQATDVPVKVSERTLQHEGMQLLALARDFGQLDWTDRSASAAQAYFSVPLVGLVHYPVSWAVFITLGLFAGWALVGVLLRLRGGRPRKALAGLLMGVAVVGLSAGAGWGLLELVRALHPEYGRLESAVYDDGMHLKALMALAVAVVLGGYALARRKFAVGVLSFGALAIPLGLATWLTVEAPFAAVALQFPLALALLSAVAVVAMDQGRLRRTWVWVGSLVIGAGILAVLVPSLELLSDALTLRAAPALGASMGVGLLLLLPAMDGLLRPRSWVVPAAAVAVAIALVVVATPAVQSEARHPMHTSLIHLVDDTLNRVLAADPPPGNDSDSVGNAPDPEVVRWVPGRWLTVSGPGEEWARSWVVDAVVGSSAPGVLLLPMDEQWVVAGTGPETELAPPSIRLVEDSVINGRRRLRLAVQSGLQGEMMGVHLPDGVVGDLAGVAEQGWARAGDGAVPVRTLTHWGQPEGGAVTVDFWIEGSQTEVEFDLIEHHLRPTEVLGSDFFRRDESVVADALAGSDRIIQRTRVRLSW